MNPSIYDHKGSALGNYQGLPFITGCSSSGGKSPPACGPKTEIMDLRTMYFEGPSFWSEVADYPFG